MKKKESKKALIFIAAIILGSLSIPVGILSYTEYFAWDSQLSGEFHKAAFEKDGALYEMSVQSSSLAFDTGTGEDHLYLKSPYFLGELIAFGHGDYEVEKTDNPFFAGKVRPKSNPKYSELETKYRTPTESFQSYKFYDRDRNLIAVYEPETPNEFVVLLRPTFPAFSKSRYTLGNKREYLDATKFLKEKLNKNLKIRTDEANKLLILRFE